MRLRALLWMLAAACLAALLALPAGAVVRRPSAAEGTLSVKDGKGIVRLTLRGSVVGTVDDATKITVVDGRLDDLRTPKLRGCEERRRPSARRYVCEGEEVRLRAVGGSYIVRIVGVGIDLSAVGRGEVTLDGDERFLDTGVYSVNGDAFKAVPYEAGTFRIGPPPE